MNFKNEMSDTSRGTVVVWGMLASMPFGGMIWQVFHHLEGFRRLGFDVWYVEDSLNTCMHPETWGRVENYEDTERFLAGIMRTYGFEDRWVFRLPEFPDVCVGCRDSDGLHDLYREADAVFNLCGANRVRPEHSVIENLVMIQTDPVAPQIWNAKGYKASIDYHSRHHHHFTYAENIGKESCSIPADDFEWIPTRPPVVTDWWTSGEGPSEPVRFTTIGNWNTKGKDIEWEGKELRWNKSFEFKKLSGLPRRSPVALELALVGIVQDETSAMEKEGWIIASARNLSGGDAYRRYIIESYGEFTVAKEQYVRSGSGWFSDRSVCYLAAGRPVVTLSTGFEENIPTGDGLFAYRTEDEAAAALDEIASNYAHHCAAALEIAREYFESEKICAGLLNRVGIL